MPIESKEIDRIKLGSTEYIIKDSATNSELNELSTELNGFEQDTQAIFDSLNTFVSYTSTFIDRCECTVDLIEDDLYCLNLSM